MATSGQPFSQEALSSIFQFKHAQASVTQSRVCIDSICNSILTFAQELHQRQQVRRSSDAEERRD